VETTGGTGRRPATTKGKGKAPTNVVYSEEDELEEDDEDDDDEMGAIKVVPHAGGGSSSRRTILLPDAESESPARKSQVKTKAGGTRKEVVTIEESSDSDNQTFRGACACACALPAILFSLSPAGMNFAH
jgi:hypothetical protein